MTTTPIRSAEDIFKEDRLLLHPKSQIHYGRTILWNVLTNRTTSSYVPVDARPGRESSRPSSLPVPGNLAELKQAYVDYRISRKRLPPEVEAKLRTLTMVADGRKTIDRRQDKGVYKRRHEVDPEIQKLAADGKRIVRIAAVGFRVKIGLRDHTGYLDEDLVPAMKADRVNGLPDGDELRQLGRTMRNPARKDDAWEETVVNHIQTAIKSDSQIVVLGEFALPPLRNEGDARGEVELAIASCCADHGGENHFVFAGSRHQGAYNIGFMHLLEAKKPEQKWQYKVASARGLGENVLGPQSGELASYSTTIRVGDHEEDLNIIVAICYDAFDPSMFLNLIMQSVAAEEDYKERRVILVPSFNPSQEFVDMLRDLSFVTNCPVLYVNSLHGDARMFVSGFAVRDIRGDNVQGIIEYLDAELKKRSDERRQKKRGTSSTKPLPTDKDHDDYDNLKGEDIHIRQLMKDLRNLQSRNALNNLITVEHCERCEGQDGGHTNDYNCKNDIIYYNIDLELLDALNIFRQSYFTNDSFLPEPFTMAGREELLRQVREKEKKRAERFRQSQA